MCACSTLTANNPTEIIKYCTYTHLTTLLADNATNTCTAVPRHYSHVYLLKTTFIIHPLHLAHHPAVMRTYSEHLSRLPEIDVAIAADKSTPIMNSQGRSSMHPADAMTNK
jgi:hypothetical protein